MSYEFAEPYKLSVETPDFWEREYDKRILHLPINEPHFVNNGSLVRESSKGTLSIDTADKVLRPDLGEPIKNGIGIVRVAHAERGIIGFIADLRSAKAIMIRDLESGEYNNEAFNRNEAHKNEPLLGAVFEEKETGKLYFMSRYHDDLLPYAASLLEYVDAAKASSASDETADEPEAKTAPVDVQLPHDKPRSRSLLQRLGRRLAKLSDVQDPNQG